MAWELRFLPGLAEIWIGPVGAADWLVKWMEPAWTGLVRCLGRESNAIAYAFAMAVGYGYGYIRSGTLKVLDGFAVAGLWTVKVRETWHGKHAETYGNREVLCRAELRTYCTLSLTSLPTLHRSS